MLKAGGGGGGEETRDRGAPIWIYGRGSLGRADNGGRFCRADCSPGKKGSVRGSAKSGQRSAEELSERKTVSPKQAGTRISPL